MRLLAYGIFGLCTLAVPLRAAAKCDDPAAVAAARAAADAECGCATSDDHGDYVSCVSDFAKTFPGLPKDCRGEVVSCAGRSTCGKPGFVTCCRTTSKGKFKCSTKSDVSKCKAPNGGTAVVGTGSCCDPCQGTTTTSTTPATTSTTQEETTTTTHEETTTTQEETTTTTHEETTTTTHAGSPSAAFAEHPAN
jgi:hypothetical protein